MAMYVKRKAGSSFFSAHFYLPLFLFICMYSRKSYDIEEHSSEMFGSNALSRLSKQFLLHGAQKFVLNEKKGNKSTQLL